MTTNWIYPGLLKAMCYNAFLSKEVLKSRQKVNENNAKGRNVQFKELRWVSLWKVDASKS